MVRPLKVNTIALAALYSANVLSTSPAEGHVIGVLNGYDFKESSSIRAAVQGFVGKASTTFTEIVGEFGKEGNKLQAELDTVNTEIERETPSNILARFKANIINKELASLKKQRALLMKKLSSLSVDEFYKRKFVEQGRSVFNEMLVQTQSGAGFRCVCAGISPDVKQWIENIVTI